MRGRLEQYRRQYDPGKQGLVVKINSCQRMMVRNGSNVLKGGLDKWSQLQFKPSYPY